MMQLTICKDAPWVLSFRIWCTHYFLHSGFFPESKGLFLIFWASEMLPLNFASPEWSWVLQVAASPFHTPSPESIFALLRVHTLPSSVSPGPPLLIQLEILGTSPG